MVRKIVDYSKLDEDILSLLVAKFPDGYNESDIITFRNASNEVIEAVEVRTEDTVYLVKIGKRLIEAMEDFIDDEDDIDHEQESDDLVIDDVEQESSEDNY